MTPAEIASNSACFRCLDDFQSSLLYILATMADVTVDEIAENSACFSCISDKQSAMLYLLNQLAGSMGGGGQIVEYTTTGPTADAVVPNDLDAPAIAVKPGGSTFTWDATLHVWDDV